MDEYEHIREQESWTEYMRSRRNEHISDALEVMQDLDLEEWQTSPSQEREDIELAQQLIQVGQRILKRYNA